MPTNKTKSLLGDHKTSAKKDFKVQKEVNSLMGSDYIARIEDLLPLAAEMNKFKNAISRKINDLKKEINNLRDEELAYLYTETVFFQPSFKLEKLEKDYSLHVSRLPAISTLTHSINASLTQDPRQSTALKEIVLYKQMRMYLENYLTEAPKFTLLTKRFFFSQEESLDSHKAAKELLKAVNEKITIIEKPVIPVTPLHQPT